MDASTSVPILQVGQRPRRAIDLVVIHCSATPSGKPLRQGVPGQPGFLNAPQVINAWHAARQFKRDPAAVLAFSSVLPSIGYHYVIDLTGEVWNGRHVDEVGAHAAQFNAASVGVCLVGGAERDAQYTTAQWRSLAQVVSMLLVDHGIPRSAPRRTPDRAHPLGYRVSGGVCGHRDLSPDADGDGLVESFEWKKTCPGFSVAGWLARGMLPENGQICEVRP